MKKVIYGIKKHAIKSTLVFIGLVLYAFCLPTNLFNKPTSTVIESVEGELLGAMIAEDGQWRFPANDSIPEKFKQCIIQFEDAYFYKHIGINPISIYKALQVNFKHGKIIRGGSTITQQVIRLSRAGKSRTYFEKIIEAILATRLELRASKEKILSYYVANAPFGGNVVGLEVAAWRYFGVQAHQLSWAESATLAVLPNAPSLIYPGKNQQQLKVKRDRLLEKLLNNGIIDRLTYQLAIEEELPQKPYPLPQVAKHLLQEVARSHKGKRFKTSLNYYLQNQVNGIVNQHHDIQKQNEVHNLAVLVLDVKKRKVLSYVGNTNTTKQHHKDVNIITAPRSTGSVLKPLLYTAMLDKGELLPNALVADVPTSIADYEPENFDLQYTGAISAQKALARSLNIPAVRMLSEYGLARFYDELKQFNTAHINKNPNHYGLSLILGGAEASLWDLCNMYAALAATVNHYTETSSEYYKKEIQEWTYNARTEVDLGNQSAEKSVFDAGSIYLAFEAMKEVNRPDGDEAWKFYDSSKEIAWKTGTSFGNRDAWAIGVTQDVVVGVWVGNADGEGRPNLTGVAAAGPVMFDVFNVLPRSKWFSKPYDALVQLKTCKQSGYLATKLCNETKIWAPNFGERFKACPYHKWVHLDQGEQYRVNASCAPVEAIKNKSWFVLPPLMEWYYKKQHANYKPLPPLRSDCNGFFTKRMDFIFPKANSKLILPKNNEGKINKAVFKIAHTQPNTKVYWYLDNNFIKATQEFHEIAVLPPKGDHVLTVVDELGNELRQTITVSY